MFIFLIINPLFTGQPVLIGGTMGTCSYVLTGTQTGMDETFGSTCHGAGRAQSRNASRRKLDYQEVKACTMEYSMQSIIVELCVLFSFVYLVVFGVAMILGPEVFL